MWQSVALVHFNGMALKPFYSRVESECKEKCTMSFYNVLACAEGQLLRQWSSQSDLIHYTHTSHTEEALVFPKCIYSTRGKGEKMYTSLCQVRHCVPASANRLVLWDWVNSCNWTDVLSVSVAVSPSSTWNLSSTFCLQSLFFFSQDLETLIFLSMHTLPQSPHNCVSQECISDFSISSDWQI